jgi:2-iminobutanoate/2-iminopropanoate deaminase
VQGPLSNYELATRAGDYTFYAGVIGAHPETGLIIYGANELKDADWPRPPGGLASRVLREPISAQTYTIYKLMRDMLAEHGVTFDNLLRVNIYLRDMAELPEVERIGAHFFHTRLPAGTLIGVESLARRDFYIEIEGITYAHQNVRHAPSHPGVASWGAICECSARRRSRIYLRSYRLRRNRRQNGQADIGPELVTACDARNRRSRSANT